MAQPPVSPNLTGLGVAYYPEYLTVDRLDDDLDLMVAAGVTHIRVGESVWSTWEPRNGEFDLEWLTRTLDGAHQRGLAVILGTPTYAVPPWLQMLHPEIAGEQATGVQWPWGWRQEVDYTHPTFRYYSERIIRQILERHAKHPAVVGFQVDNEPGMFAFHNDHVFKQFVENLRKRYGSVDELNSAWGLTFWSHRIAEWNELWRSDGNSSPQYDLAWRQFQANLTTQFIEWQASIVREYSSDSQFVMTCIAYDRPGIEDDALTLNLDVTGANPYHGVQDHLQADVSLAPMTAFASTGVWGLYRQADRAWSSKQEQFLVTETNSGAISHSHQNYPSYPGQLVQAAVAMLSRGATMIEYWQWHSLHSGAEWSWGGILPHSQVPGRIYREVSQVGDLIRQLRPVLDSYTPDFDIALLYSNNSKWAFNFNPPLHNDDGSPDRQSYDRIFDSFYQGANRAGLQVRIVHDSQLGDSAEELARNYPILVVPGFFTANDRQLELLRDYAAAGGHLVVGIRTAYGDEEARARRAVAPDILRNAGGVSYTEYTHTDHDVEVASDQLELESTARATIWVDLLDIESAQTLVSYASGTYRGVAAVSNRAHGAGQITYVGTIPNPALAASLFRWMRPQSHTAAWAVESGVAVTSGRTASNDQVWFVHNWSDHDARVAVPLRSVDLATGLEYLPGQELSLSPWGVRILVSE